MAESPMERLKRLAAEKKAALGAQPAVIVAKVIPPEETIDEQTTSATLAEVSGSEQTTEAGITATTELEHSTSSSEREPAVEQAACISSVPSVTISACESGPAHTPSEHPLAMQFAELESMLLAQDPEFKTILRQVHRHLGQDPELVTMMTEGEVQLIVTGMVVFAQAEIVEPAKAKTAKAAVSAAKKKVITADDL